MIELKGNLFADKSLTFIYFDTIINVSISVLNVNAKCIIGGVMEFKWRISISILMIHLDFERYFGT